jgi:hypothetical protein
MQRRIFIAIAVLYWPLAAFAQTATPPSQSASQSAQTSATPPAATPAQNPSQPQTPAPTDDSQPIAAITSVTGDVMVQHATVWTRVDAVPLNLFTGDTVSTDKGRAEIHFLGDSSTLDMDVGTQIVIEQQPASAGAQMLRRVQIFLGDVWFKMEHSLTRQTLLVTPTAIGGLRGTEGLVHVEDQSHSSFSLTTGQLAITQHALGEAAPAPGAAQKVELLNPGQEMRAERGKPLLMRRMKSPIVRPDVKVAAAKLPSPRGNWRSRLPENRRPPLARTLPRSSMRLNAAPRPNANPRAIGNQSGLARGAGRNSAGKNLRRTPAPRLKAQPKPKARSKPKPQPKPHSRPRRQMGGLSIRAQSCAFCENWAQVACYALKIVQGAGSEVGKGESD